MNRLGIYICFVVVVLSACTGLKRVPKGELLYTGAKIEIVTSDKIKKKGEVKSAVSGVIRPKPNKKFLWMRPGLWLYYATGNPKKPKSVRSWLKNKIAQPPVYLSSVDVALVAKGVDAKLYNTGFLDSYCDYRINEHKKGKKASLVITLHLKQPYTIADIAFPQDTAALSRAITRTEKRTRIKKGDRYNLETLVEERLRIDNSLKRRGYYYFNPDYILYVMDTSHSDRTVRLRTTIKPEIPEKARLVYTIAEVNVFPDYKMGIDSITAEKIVIDSINYYRETKYIRPRPIINSILIKPNRIYNRRLHQATLSRLNGLGVFKFININFSDVDTADKALLKADISLMPLPKKSIGLEVQMATKSNNFIGPALTLSLRNRNAFKGAELMIYNLRGSFETQYSGEYKGLFTYEVNPRIELSVPRIISPFKVKGSNMFVPRTRFSLEYSYLSRVGYFDMNSFKLATGYRWKQTLEIDHDLTLLNVNYYNIYNRSDRFSELINSNLLIRRRFENQFLAGIAYSFFYNGQVRALKRNAVYFNGNAEVAGNTLALFSYAITKKPVNGANPSQILGVNFAQFARFDFDIRDYLRIKNDVILATRFVAGWGIPYGNAITLPYAKQFFAGGAYSVRGFPANTLGPGAYAPPDSVRNVFYLQQGGEIKLEANIELRFPIVKFFKGAVFFDVGNTWLNKPSKDAPGGEFRSDLFLKQLAMATGAGVRLDLEFFVLRLDVGIPLRKPSEPEPDRWIIERLKFKNVVFNLAFGYPF